MGGVNHTTIILHAVHHASIKALQGVNSTRRCTWLLAEGAWPVHGSGTKQCSTIACSGLNEMVAIGTRDFFSKRCGSAARPLVAVPDHITHTRLSMFSLGMGLDASTLPVEGVNNVPD